MLHLFSNHRLPSTSMTGAPLSFSQFTRALPVATEAGEAVVLRSIASAWHPLVGAVGTVWKRRRRNR